MNASLAVRAIAITSLVALAAAAPPQMMRTPPRPVVRNPNAPQADWQSAPTTGQFTSLAFNIVTGDDDLRGDSSAWVDLNFADGTKQKCLLKAYGGDSWPNGSPHTSDIPQCKLQAARTFDDLKKADIILVYDGLGHAGAFETEDNWNVDQIEIDAQDFVNHAFPCLIRVASHPVVRLKVMPPTGPNNFPYSEGGTGSFDLSQTPSTC